MKIITLAVNFLMLSISSFAQKNDLNKQAEPIVAEGKRLYRSEKAPWDGTDIFITQYKNQNNIGGYFSYTSGDSSHCIFYSREESPQVIGEVAFDSTYNIHSASLNLKERNFTRYEADLYSLRKRTEDILRSNDTFFRFYENSHFNIVPMIENGERKVYLLTGSTRDDVVIFGNDYLLKFNASNKLISKKSLHRNAIIADLNAHEDGKKTEGAIHSHVSPTSEFMTPTDICTIMLYEKLAKWESYVVVSEKYISIWSCESNSLYVIDDKAAKKIDEDQKRDILRMISLSPTVNRP